MNTVFVDLSNVCKDPGLGESVAHAALVRWVRLKAAWLRSRGGSAGFVLVADSSLRRALSMADAEQFDRLQAAGEVVVVADADVEILLRAIEAGGVALSNDRYVDHRRISGLERVQLVGWSVQGREIRFHERSLERLLSAIISFRQAKQDLKGLGLREGSPELGYKWFCRDSACDEELVAVPDVRRGTPQCPTCSGYLDKGDAWDKPVWLKLMHGDRELSRAVIEDGDILVVGSGEDVADDVLVPVAPTDFPEMMRLSARHAQFSNRDGRLLVQDLGSDMGTALRKPGAGQLNRLSPPLPVGSSPQVVGIGVKVVLGGTRFTVQISRAV